MAVVEVSDPGQLREMIDSGKPLVVMFSADWCGDCKTLAPHFEKHSGTLEKAGVTVARISLSQEKREIGGAMKAAYLSEAHSAMREEFAKHGFPTVVFFKERRVFSSTLEDTEASFKKMVDYVVSRVKDAATCTGTCAASPPTGERQKWNDVRLLGTGLLPTGAHFHDSTGPRVRRNVSKNL